MKFKAHNFFGKSRHGGGGVLLPWKSWQEGGLVLEEIQLEGAVKKHVHLLGVCGFFCE